MTVTGILRLVVLCALVAAPARAQTLDNEVQTDVAHCGETWPEDEPKRALCLFKWMIRRHSLRGLDGMTPLEDVPGDSPLRCADDRREASGRRLSCSTEPLNLAGAPRGERP